MAVVTRQSEHYFDDAKTMNPFLSNSAPYVLVVILGAIGWLISHAVDKMDDMLIITYDEHHDGGVYIANIKNSSLKNTLNYDVSLVCERNEDCFQFNSCEGRASIDACVTGVQAQLQTVPPWTLYRSAIDRRSSDASVILARLELPPQASIVIRAETVGGGDPIFYFGNRDGSEVATTRLLLVRPGQYHLMIYSLYYYVLFYAFLGIFLVLLIWLCVLFVKKFAFPSLYLRKRTEQWVVEPTDDTPRNSIGMVYLVVGLLCWLWKRRGA